MPVVQANGIELHYTERGTGEPLVLLMGLGGDGSLWEEHVQAYERHFRCILVDNRGAGRSAKPEGPYTTAMMAEDTLGMMDALGIESAHVSGISMGSAIAQEMALAAPQRIRSLTLNCSWMSCDAYTEAIFKTFRAAYGNLRPDDFARLLQLIIYTPQFHANQAERLAAAREEAQSSAERMPAHAFQAQCDACMSHHTTDRLGAIKVPVLLTVGDRDMFTPLALSQAIAAQLPHARLEVFEGSGHTHHWDAIERFNTVTMSFLLDNKS
ncbi:alpha/beta fold hydrolase [Paenibacillaceae bacterium]|nr:alpha/beta fold hydrolase [Paenibacillaceae bacterium]